MMFFRWSTSDTKKEVKKGSRKIFLLIPEDAETLTIRKENGCYICDTSFKYRKFYEDNYSEYGLFGGRNIFALLAMWNKPERAKTIAQHLVKMCEESGTPLTNEILDDALKSLGEKIAEKSVKNKKIQFPLKFVENKHLVYERVKPSKVVKDWGSF